MHDEEVFLPLYRFVASRDDVRFIACCPSGDSVDLVRSRAPVAARQRSALHGVYRLLGAAE